VNAGVNAAIQLSKTGVLDITVVPPATQADIGDVIDYTFTVTNTGNVTLDSIVVSDPLPGLSEITCGSTSLSPGISTDCSASYTLTQADLDAGAVINTATAEGTDPNSTVVSDVASESVAISQAPGIDFAKSHELTDDADSDGLVSAGDTLTYSYVVTNIGNVTLTGVGITDPHIGLSAISCPDTSVAVGTDMTCTATYLVTQTDVDAGVIENTATADSLETDPITTDPYQVIVPQAPAIDLVKSHVLADDADSDGQVSEGDTLEYSYLVTNIGDQTLSGVTVSDDHSGLSAITCTPLAPATLAPLETMDCTATYLVTQADVDTGLIENTGEADSDQTGLVIDLYTIDVPQAPAMSLVKTPELTTDVGGDGEIDAGDTLTYSYLVTNIGDMTLTGVTVSDPHVGLSAFTCTPTPPGTLAPLATMDCSATYVVTQADADAGVIENTGTADSDQTAPVTDFVQLLLDQNPAASLVKSHTLTTDVDSDGQESLGDTLTYSYLVTNTGDVTITGVEVTDPHTGLSTIDCPSTTLLVSGDMTCTATYLVTQADVNAGVIDNTGTVDSAQTDPVTASDQVLIPPANLIISKTDNPDPVIPGETLTYQLTVTNNGPSMATGTTLVDDLPPEVDFLSASAGCTHIAGTVTCILGNLINGATAEVTINVQVDPTALGQITNSATVSSRVHDPIPANNTAGEGTTVNARADLSVSKTDDRDPAVAGGILTYQMTVSNNGPSQATDVSLTDILPNQVAFNSASGGCQHSAGEVTCDLGDMAPGDSVQVSINVTVNASASGTLQNQASVSSVTADTVTANNSDGEITTVDAEIPEVGWIYPSEGTFLDVVGQVITLKAKASDDVAVDYVMFERWDPGAGEWIELGNDNTNIYQVDFNTSVLNQTYNELRITAFDTVGRKSVDNIDVTRAWLFLTDTLHIHLPTVSP
jgi:uncharacterized repeat protein (TIGR01451 family)